MSCPTLYTSESITLDEQETLDLRFVAQLPDWFEDLTDLPLKERKITSTPF